ncbi:DUF1285 domain-containing protein [Thalassotalea litorea]|uniref:DUF1285 domain-containing protein n=1 Tax=Thalassotalea litorea TaxID=2020715 RepID=A0A5R9IJH5_9GAMM|nr:DUF1285 domain-containing protein [Thalassotalea litorea]TLU65675.1 DUF1285 domain-containing protein [Thalassotalea litorea]
MSLEHLAKGLNLDANEGPPIEKWNPPFCGDIPIKIDGNGKWFYQGSEISRQSMVKLFSTVLWFENDEYFLVTPVEKVRIEVEDLPFIITQWQNIKTDSDESHTLIQVSTSLENSVVISNKNPIEIDTLGLKVRIRRNLYARVHRNVYYQWAEIAKVQTDPTQPERQSAVISSAGSDFSIGNL